MKEIEQTLMQRVVQLRSYAFVEKFDKIAQTNIRFSRNRCCKFLNSASKYYGTFYTKMGLVDFIL